MVTKKNKIMIIISLLLINIVLFIAFFLLYFLTKNTFFFIVYFYILIFVNLFLYVSNKNRIESINKERIENVMNVLSIIDLKNKNSSSYLRKLEILNKKIIDNELINFFEKIEVEDNVAYYKELSRNYKSNDLDSILLNIYLYKQKNDDILLNQNKIIVERSIKTIDKNNAIKENHLIIYLGIIFALIFLLVIVYEGTYLWIGCYQ